MEADPGEVRALAAALGWPAAAAAVLVSRGVKDPAAARAWLEPRRGHLADPFRLPGMDAAAGRLADAVIRRERITVFGDYDVDGISATALLGRILDALGAEVRLFLPHRMDEGYGLSVEAFARCRDETAPDLVVTVDCGTGSVEAVRNASALGMDVLVTDHHQPSDAVAPAVAVVNPKLGGHEDDQLLAGVGVAFKLAHATLKRLQDRGVDMAPAREQLGTMLALVALGTIADIVPLTGENRLLVRHGLAELNRDPWPWIPAMREVAGIREGIDTYEVGFLIGPRLNAAGRLGDAEKSLRLLMTGDPAEARRLARELDGENRTRQDMEKAMVADIVAREDPGFDPSTARAIVASGEDWHPGVAGIVASRLVARYHRPAIVLAMDAATGQARGSCRSLPGLNMVDLLAVCREHLKKYGGHHAAAGLEMDLSRIPAFAEAFRQAVGEAWSEAMSDPVHRVDAWVDLKDCADALLDALELLRPFGMGYPTPVFAARGVTFDGEPREVGQGHLKGRLRQAAAVVDAIGFGMFDKPIPDGPLDVLFTLRRNTWRGLSRPDLHLIDWRPAS